MTDQEQRFQHRWEIRRTEDDSDSSSDDDHSRPNSAREMKQMNQKLVPAQNLEENTQQTIQCPTSLAREQKEKLSGFKKRKRKAEQPCKTHERKAKTKRTKKTTTKHALGADAALELRGHMESLFEEIKTARGVLLAWMVNEMNSLSKDDIVSAEPSGVGKYLEQKNTKRSKTPRKNPNNKREKSGKMTQNGEGGSIERRSPPSNEKVSIPPKEMENVFIDVLPIEKIEKRKGRRSRSSAKKPKTVEVEADQQSNATNAADADNYLTLPTVLPQKQVENTERNPSEDGNEKGGGNRTALNSGKSLSSHQLKFDPRPQQSDEAFTESGMRSVSNYEQNTGPTMGDGNGCGFPFSLVPQVSNGGIGMPSIHNQFGLQNLSQGNRIPGMFWEHPGIPIGFMGSYSGLNQIPNFDVQQTGVMGLQCPDIRRGGAFNQDNMTNQYVFNYKIRNK